MGYFRGWCVKFQMPTSCPLLTALAVCAPLPAVQYMQSFAGVGSVGSDKLLVPANVLDKWYNRVSHRLERDPDFLSRSRDALL